MEEKLIVQPLKHVSYFGINHFKVTFESFDCLMAKRNFTDISFSGNAGASEQNKKSFAALRRKTTILKWNYRIS